VVVGGIGEVLAGAEVALGGLDRGVAEQELDPLEVAAPGPAELGAGPAEVVGPQPAGPGIAGRWWRVGGRPTVPCCNISRPWAGSTST
jgi:hypothetical protein